MPAIFRTRRPTAFERLALQQPKVVNGSPDWARGLLVILAAVLALGWIDANDNAVFMQEQANRVAADSARWKARAEAIETTAAVRLVHGPEGFRCQAFNIQREWELVVAAECKRLAGILRTARATR